MIALLLDEKNQETSVEGSVRVQVRISCYKKDT